MFTVRIAGAFTDRETVLSAVSVSGLVADSETVLIAVPEAVPSAVLALGSVAPPGVLLVSVQARLREGLGEW